MNAALNIGVDTLISAELSGVDGRQEWNAELLFQPAGGVPDQPVVTMDQPV
jgi:hypothetical protein